MADLHVAETCVCGANISASGYPSSVNEQMTAWRRKHNSHKPTPAIAKELKDKLDELVRWHNDHMLLHQAGLTESIGQMLRGDGKEV